MGADEDLEQADAERLSLPFPGKGVWKWCWAGGIASVSVSIALPAIFSSGSITDAPNHDFLLSVPILIGVLFMSIGGSLFALSVYGGKQTTGGLAGRSRTIVVLAVVTIVVGAYLVNPLLSPVAFLRDSDLDGAQDYNDAFPHDRSRMDHPYASHAAVYAHSSHTDTGWSVTIGSGVFSCWLEETGIKVLNPDNSTALELTLLQDLSNEAADGVRYFNLHETDRMDEGDFFLLDASAFVDGSKVQIWANTDGWQVLQIAVL